MIKSLLPEEAKLVAINLERFKKDLSKLVEAGGHLMNSMMREVHGDAFDKQVKKSLGDKAAAFLKELPKFNTEYEAWYSESLALLRQLLPDRVQNFISLYEKPKNRKELQYGNYVMQDYLQGLRSTRGWDKEVVVGTSAAIPQFEQQLAILKAAQGRFDSSLFEIRQLVQADLFDSEIDSARELLKGKFYRAAGIVAGVVLEKHLLQVCSDHQVKITKKNPTISELNDLLKSSSVIDVPQWRFISMLGDIRNICGHHKGNEPTATQTEDLIAGADKVIKTVF